MLIPVCFDSPSMITIYFNGSLTEKEGELIHAPYAGARPIKEDGRFVCVKLPTHGVGYDVAAQIYTIEHFRHGVDFEGPDFIKVMDWFNAKDNSDFYTKITKRFKLKKKDFQEVYKIEFVKQCFIPEQIMGVLKKVGKARLTPLSPGGYAGVDFTIDASNLKDAAIVVAFLYRAETVNELSPKKSPLFRELMDHNNVDSLRGLAAMYGSTVDSLLDFEGEE